MRCGAARSAEGDLGSGQGNAEQGPDRDGEQQHEQRGHGGEDGGHPQQIARGVGRDAGNLGVEGDGFRRGGQSVAETRGGGGGEGGGDDAPWGSISNSSPPNCPWASVCGEVGRDGEGDGEFRGDVP